MSIKKKNIILHTSVLAIGVVLLILASFIDLKVSSALYSSSFVGVVGGMLGKLPGWGLALFACTTLFALAINKDRRDPFRIPLLLIYPIGALLCGFLMGHSIVDELAISTFSKLLFCVSSGAGFTLIGIAISLKLTPENAENLRKWCFTALVCVGVVVVITLLIKYVWGRTRYADIINNNGTFTSWYQPQGHTGNTSFPSGHTALAACGFLAVPLFRCLPHLKKYTACTFAGAFAYTAVIAVLRIVGGFHFLSDVTVSVIIAYAVIAVASTVVFGLKGDKILMSDNNILRKL